MQSCQAIGETCHMQNQVFELEADWAPLVKLVVLGRGQFISIYGLDGSRQGRNFYCNVIGDSRKRLEGRHEIHGVGKLEMEDQMGRDKSDRLEERWVVMNYETQAVGTGKGRDEGKKQTCVTHGVCWWSGWRVRHTERVGKRCGEMEEDAWETCFGERQVWRRLRYRREAFEMGCVRGITPVVTCEGHEGKRYCKKCKRKDQHYEGA